VSNVLPPLYDRWVADLLGRTVPAETGADCRNCVMVAGGRRSGDPGRRYFDSVTRCCTYLPELPNFIAGLILADTDRSSAAGRRSVEARVDRGVSVTPLGLGKPGVHTLLYAYGGDGFGASRALRCPHHLDDGGCGIWAHRMSVCATWFCKYTRGAVGQRFWRAVLGLLVGVESDLARWCLLKLRLGTRELASLLPPPVRTSPAPALDRYQLDGRADPNRYAAVWGKRAGREREFYQECGELVQRLSWEQVLAICGPGVGISARQVQDAFSALLSREVPRRLRVAELCVQSTRNAALVCTYNSYDPLRLPGSLMEALPYFDGRPVDDALRTIENEKRLRLAPELVRKLVDFSILVDAQRLPKKRKRKRGVKTS
jgi:hypothetical protein